MKRITSRNQPPYKISSCKCIYNIEYMLVITAQNAENFKKYVEKKERSKTAPF